MYTILEHRMLTIVHFQHLVICLVLNFIREFTLTTSTHELGGSTAVTIDELGWHICILGEYPQSWIPARCLYLLLCHAMDITDLVAGVSCQIGSLCRLTSQLLCHITKFVFVLFLNALIQQYKH